MHFSQQNHFTMEYQPFIYYLRFKGHPFATFVALRPGQSGWAIAHPTKDQFSYEEGRNKATIRALNWPPPIDTKKYWCRMPTTEEYRRQHFLLVNAMPDLQTMALKNFARQAEIANEA